MPRRPRPIHLTVRPANCSYEEAAQRIARATAILQRVAARLDAERKAAQATPDAAPHEYTDDGGFHAAPTATDPR